MKTGRTLLALALAGTGLMSCADNNADRDGDGVIDAGERATELAKSGLVPLKSGEWDKTFVFNEIDVRAMSDAQKKRVMTEVGNMASGKTCLSDLEAPNPGAQFFGGRSAEKCSYGKFEVGKSKAKLDVNCAMAGAGAVALELRGKMGGASFDFDTEAQVRLPVVGAIKLKGKATGRRVGSCTPTVP